MTLSRETLQQLLTPYELLEDNLELISLSQNHVYRAKRNNEYIIVRISTRRHRTLEQTEAELLWVTGLVKKDVRACLPIPTVKGHMCHEEVIDDTSYIITCFEHAQGRPLKRGESDLSEFEKIGLLTGRLHTLSSSETDFESIARPQWYESRLLNQDFREQKEVISPEFQNGVNQLMSELKCLPQENNTFGLIHGDLSFGNFYTSNKELTLIDFDNCEYGYYVQDLSVILYDAIYFKALIEYPDQDLTQTMQKYWNALLKGYFQTSPLKKIDLNVLKKLFLLREAILYVYFYRTHTQEQMNTKFFELQGLKVENIITRSHPADLSSFSNKPS